MSPGDEYALTEAEGCCGDDRWRGRLCEYHLGLADGYDAAAEKFEADRDKHAQAAELRDARWKAGFEIRLTPEIMEECRVMQEAFDRDMERIREYFNSSPPPRLFGGLQSRNNETGASNEQDNQQGV